MQSMNGEKMSNDYLKYYNVNSGGDSSGGGGMELGDIPAIVLLILWQIFAAIATALLGLVFKCYK